MRIVHVLMFIAYNYLYDCCCSSWWCGTSGIGHGTYYVQSYILKPMIYQRPRTSSSLQPRHYSSSSSSLSSKNEGKPYKQSWWKKLTRRSRGELNLQQQQQATKQNHLDNTTKNNKKNNNNNNNKKKQPKHRIFNQQDLEYYFQDTKQQFRNEKGEIDYKALLGALDVRGDTQIIGTTNYTHPVVQLLHERRKRTTNHNNNNNTTTKTTVSNQEQETTVPMKIALAIEGGGMRGCVSAGAVCAIHHLNLTHCIDVVYGSSAGSLIGSYLITEQLPWFGPELYYDKLTTAGRQFIDTKRLLRALGLGLLDPRLLKDVITRRAFGKPVLNLSFLLQTTMQETKPLDWDTFVQKQTMTPLKVVVSDLKSERSRALDMKGGYFESLSELSQCMHASCLLPGIAGPLMNMDMDVIEGRKKGPKYILGNQRNATNNIHPMADALVYEPLPYHSAIEEGATHIIVIRSRPDGVDVTGKASFFESLIYRRFFLRKNHLPHIYDLFRKQYHKKRYAEDVLELNDYAYSAQHYLNTSKPHILTIAAPPGSPEVSRLETGRHAIFEGIRRGFARAYDCLVEDPSQRGKGMEVALSYFPDEILDYDPLLINTTDESAYEFFLRERDSSRLEHS